MRLGIRLALLSVNLLVFSLVQAQPVSDASAEQKIHLLAEALKARTQGDFEQARQALESLILIAPDDPTVQRLLLEVKQGQAGAPKGPSLSVDQLVEAEALRIAGAKSRVDAVLNHARQVEAGSSTTAAAAVIQAALDGPPLPPAETARLQSALQRLSPSFPPPTGDDRALRHELQQAKAHLLAGNYNAAHEALLRAHELNPQDEEVNALLDKAALQGSGSRRLVTRSRMLRDVDDIWAKRTSASPAPSPRRQALESELDRQLGNLVLPRVSFTAMPLSQVLDALAGLAEEQGNAINLVLLQHQGEDPQISITLRNLSLKRVLDYLGNAAGYEYHLEPDAVVFRKAEGPGATLQTGFFDVSRSTILRLTGEGGDTIDPGAGDPFAPRSQPSGSVQLEQELALRSFLERAGVPFTAIPGATLALADGQLIVTQTPGNLRKVDEILYRYSQIKQVEIETRFLEVQEGALEEFGVEWLLSNVSAANGGDLATLRSQNRSLSRAFGGNAAEGELIITGLDPSVGNNGTLSHPLRPPQIGNGLDLAASALGLAEIEGLVGEFDVNAVVRALARQSGNDLMSAPKITVLSGKTAEIVVAQEMVYPRAFGDVEASVGRGSSLGGSAAGVAVTAGTPRDFAVRNVGVEMEVTPTVENDGSISLQLEPRVTEFEGFVEYGGPSVAIAGGTTVTVPSGFYQPLFSVRRVRTEVTIWDGATVVMGGLTREQVVTVKDKVPVLGDIPLLGRLFRSEGESTQKRNLLIFVTANLVGPDGTPTRYREE